MESFLCREIVPFSEGPLTEVPLYCEKYLDTEITFLNFYLILC